MAALSLSELALLERDGRFLRQRMTIFLTEVTLWGVCDVLHK
jgi:hypothetical protein